MVHNGSGEGQWCVAFPLGPRGPPFSPPHPSSSRSTDVREVRRPPASPTHCKLSLTVAHKLTHWASILGPPTSHPRPLRPREPRTANREPDETNHQPLCRWQNVCVSVAHRFHFPRVALPRTLICIALIVTFAEPARLAPWATAGHKPIGSQPIGSQRIGSGLRR